MKPMLLPSLDGDDDILMESHYQQMKARQQRCNRLTMFGLAFSLMFGAIIVFINLAQHNSRGHSSSTLMDGIGGDTDAHGCPTSAGYTWCDSTSSCIRSWETECTTAAEKLTLETDLTVSPEMMGWVPMARAEEDDIIDLTFGIALTDAVYKGLEEDLFAVSDPDSVRYGKFMNKEEIRARVKSLESSESGSKTDVVVDYLISQGVPSEAISIKGTSDWYVVARVSVKMAESLLGTEYFEWSRPSALTPSVNRTVVRCRSYSVPQTLSEIVTFVQPTHKFPGMTQRSVKKTDADMMDSSTKMTPDKVRLAYGVNDSWALIANYSIHYQAVTEFDEEYMSMTDLNAYYNKLFPQLVGTEPKVLGPNTADDPGGEANLDIQYMTAVSGGVPTEFWSFGGRSPDTKAVNEPFLAFMTYLNDRGHVPSVVSTSYGEDEGSTSFDYARKVQAEFMVAGIRGVSLLFASGDSGVASTWGACDHFYSKWPAGSPYVTAVGATQSESPNPEKVASFSSSGFSNRWAMPYYQKAAVKTYLESARDILQPYIEHGYLPHDLFTTAGRAFPDISAAGVGYEICEDGDFYTVDGTSCAAPTIGGIIGLLNDNRMSSGKPVLGFLNPLLYKYAAANQKKDIVKDITEGNNHACKTTGLHATSGWDAAAGWGTPRYEKLKELVLNL